MQIEVEVKGQRIKRINSPGSVEDTLNYLTCYFTFDGEEWDNTAKTAYFRNPASGKIYSQILAEDNTCTVPWEALTDQGFVKFSVSGERENYRITTDIESFYNGETVYGGEPSEPPTPSQYDQLIALAQETKEIAESVREDADAGEFDGEPGKPGDPGKDGVSPTAKVEQTDDGAVITITDATGTTTAELKNGKEGNPGQNATDEQVRGAVDAYMAEHPVQVDTDDLIKIAIKEEASGAVPIVTTDSAEMGVQDLTMQGWTEQDSTTGANLIDYTQAIPRNENQSVEIIDGGVKWTGDYYFKIPVAGLKKNQNYIMSYESDNAGSWAFSYSDGTFSPTESNNRSETTDPEKDCSAVFIYKTRPTVAGQDMVFTNIMLNAGSTALPYEPYTGGTPSPSPDYPQEIVSAGKYDEGTGKWKYEVGMTGKNLLPYGEGDLEVGHPYEYQGRTYVLNEDGSITITTQDSSKSAGNIFVFGTRIDRKHYKLPAGKYTVSTFNGNIPNMSIQLEDENGVNTRVVGTGIFELKEHECIAYAWLYGSSGTEWNGTIYPQLEYGGGSTSYEQYKLPQTITLTADRPLTKWDKLEKRNGQWGWAYKSNVVEYDGSTDEVWIYISDGAASRAYTLISGIDGECLCDKFPKGNAVNEGCFDISLNCLRFNVYNIADSAESWKTWLQSNPITVWHETIQETFVPLSESEQEALNALHTYYPTTVLSNDTECEMSIKYIADTKTYIDSKIAAIQAAIINTI